MESLINAFVHQTRTPLQVNGYNLLIIMILTWMDPGFFETVYSLDIHGFNDNSMMRFNHDYTNSQANHLELLILTKCWLQ